MAGRKKLTNAEKKRRAQVKKQLQAEGILPPDKPRLNRKKYIEESLEIWNEKSVKLGYAQEFWLLTSVMLLIKNRDRKLNYTPENIGVAKVLRMAIRLFEFEEKIRQEGRTEYKITEQYEYIKDILEA